MTPETVCTCCGCRRLLELQREDVRKRLSTSPAGKNKRANKNPSAAYELGRLDGEMAALTRALEGKER